MTRRHNQTTHNLHLHPSFAPFICPIHFFIHSPISFHLHLGHRPCANSLDRMLKDTTPLQRGIIRHLVIIIDLSIAMAEKDLRPTRCLLTLRYAAEFVTEFFEQNPISQLGIVGMRDGLAVRVSDMSGNPSDHITNLHALREKEPKGDASLQNALDMGRGALLSVPIFHTCGDRMSH